MKRIWLAMILVLVVLLKSRGAAAAANGIVSLDGSWWDGLTTAQQLFTVQALLAGYTEGYNNGFIKAAYKDKTDFHSTRSGTELTTDPDRSVRFSKTFRAYRNEITGFYSRYSGSTDVRVGNVMACLSDEPQFSCDTVAKFHPRSR